MQPATPDTRWCVGLVLLWLATFSVFSPTLNHRFLPLGFDDAIVLHTSEIRALTWDNLRALVTRSYHAHWTPLTMFSLAVDYHLWRFDPFGYHLGNVLLHATNALLLAVFLAGILPGRGLALFAAVVFALHPVQTESVAVVMQRKTVLSGTFFLLTLIFYLRWLRRRRVIDYAAAVVSFLAAALAKPNVVPLPILLLLLDHSPAGGGRLRYADKLPFFIVSALAGVAALAAHAAVNARHALHGGDLLTHVLMVSRVLVEYGTALLFPVDLSPIYYYPMEVGRSVFNFLALGLVLFFLATVIFRRNRNPWLFFCVAWFIIALAPEANIVPLAQLRADRFLYLPIIGFAIGTALGGARLVRHPSLRRCAASGVISALALMSVSETAVWRDQVTVWERVVERHPWYGLAYIFLGQTYIDKKQPLRAEQAWKTALALNPNLSDAHFNLAQLYVRQGRLDDARTQLERFLQLVPGDPAGFELLGRLQTSTTELQTRTPHSEKP